MTKSHTLLRQVQSQTSDTLPNPPSDPADLERAQLSQGHLLKPAIRELQEEAEQSLRLSRNRDVADSKWPKGIVTAGVVMASLLLWALIVAVIRQTV